MAKIVTITNPLTGQPAQVDQLEHTAQQIDDGLNIARNVSNPNLLDNWYFGNPVDQRGGYVITPNTRIYSDAGLTNLLATAGPNEYVQIQAVTEITDTYVKFVDSGGSVRYTEAAQAPVRGYTGVGYGIDRWYGDGILIEPNGLTLTAQGKYILQNLDDELKKALDGETVTVSALLSTGELLFGTKVYAAAPSANEYFVAGALHIVNNTSGGILFLAQQKATISAAKLELGSQQTLAHQENGVWVLNEIPNYGEQLRRCVSSTADPSDPYANVPQRRNNRVIAVKTINGLTTTVYSNDVTVTVSILGAPTEAISKGTALCDTLPVKYRPPIDYYVRSFYDDETSNVVGVNTTGSITNPLANLKAGAYHRAVLTYSI